MVANAFTKDILHIRFDETEVVQVSPRRRKQYAWINLRDGDRYAIGEPGMPPAHLLEVLVRGVPARLVYALERVGDSVVIDSFKADSNGKPFVELWREDADGVKTYCDGTYQSYDPNTGKPQLHEEVAKMRTIVPFKVFKLRAWYDATNNSA